MKKYYVIYLFVILSFIILILYQKNINNKEYIDFNDTVETKINEENDNIIKIGMISIVGDSQSYLDEKRLVNYIGEKLNKEVKLIQKKSYREINSLLKSGDLDIAFLSTGAYSLYDDKNSLELIARPNRGNGYYHACVIVNKNSDIATFEDLKGKDFAFIDTYSYSGYLVLSEYLKKEGTSVNKFFNDKYYFTYSNSESIKEVINDNVQGAVVDDWILQYMNKNSPGELENIKIIKEFDDVATGPVVTSKNYKDKEKLRNILLTINQNIKLQDILDRLQIKKYEKTEESNYPILVEEGSNGK